ncbi:MAG: response regulator transcription factor [Hydrogenothermaceae bacterium]|nr:response regulator transcription factor [Hydrogenothermaceae bacterium]
MKVLIIEDDFYLSQALKDYLSSNGIEAEILEDEREVEYTISVSEYDVIILDLMLKYSKGEDILRNLRERDINTPILIITAKTKIEDKENCYNLGADDYLTKPFEPKELLLKVKALANRLHLPNIQKIGDVEIDLQNKIVKKNGEVVKLSKTAWNLLYYLLKRRGEVVHTESILNYVWGGKAVGDEVVRSYIKELRKILPEDTIETFKGRGYRLK